MTARILRHLTRPLRGGAGLVIVVFSTLLFIASYAGLFGIPLGLILVSWFFKYAYILFDAVSRGFDEPPALDIQSVNPANEQRPLGQILILGLGAGLATLAEMYISRSFAVSVVAISMFLLPASAAVLGMEGHLLKAIHPMALWQMVDGMGALYFVLLAAIFVYAGVGAVLAGWHAWRAIELVYAMFAILSLFSLMGGMVYERRDELGIEVWISPERTAAKAQAEQLKQDAQFVAEVYGRIRAGHHIDAWDTLVGWLAQRGNRLEDYRWLAPRVATWEDMRYATRLTQEFLERLLTFKQSGEALRVAAGRLDVDPTFRPRTPQATLTLALLASKAGGTLAITRAFASDFDARFPGDPGVAAARALLLRNQS